MLLIPAPQATRATSPILFYSLNVTQGSTTVLGLDRSGTMHAHAQIDALDDHGFDATIGLRKTRQIRLEGRMRTAEEPDATAVEGLLEGRRYTITAAAAVRLDGVERTFEAEDGPGLERWHRLLDPLDVLGTALGSRPAQFDAAGEFCGVVLSTGVVGVATCLASIPGGPLATLIECPTAVGRIAGYVAHC
jgi:hypothetical protein